ncbi:MAG: hypothetical protein H0A75_06050 [Candidatus Methanofishera endochildressiae]|uniref:Uncharacterized protein n=1 Tax=Candidatus Methanofishera endochildressiae TaxID=2738884 RepID=A0A7Z0MP96_9GAMM|nr:hypothetical protein [Candidatus Methanofishera endochildressiae]
MIYNYSRNEVKNFTPFIQCLFLVKRCASMACDAVASMLYLDYSREENDWLPNMYGGNENLEAIDFLRELNTITHEQHPGTVVIAEKESDFWPQIHVNLDGKQKHEMEYGLDACATYATRSSASPPSS